MVKHTQTNRRQIADDLFECLSVFDHFSGLALKGLRLLKFTLRKNRLNIVYVDDSIQQERLLVSLVVGRIYF